MRDYTNKRACNKIHFFQLMESITTYVMPYLHKGSCFQSRGKPSKSGDTDGCSSKRMSICCFAVMA